MCDIDVIASTEEQIAQLRLRLPALEGKTHKKERAQINKAIYNLENADDYVAASRAKLMDMRAEHSVAVNALDQAADCPSQESAVASQWHMGSNGSAETQTERTLRIYWRAQVEGLFDDYAKTFEHSLVKQLGYDVPAQMTAVLAQTHANEDGSVSRCLAVDLGCGTGLAGAALRSRCHGRLVGCDLSSKMVEEARKKSRVFDELEACDCIAYLQRRVARSSADLIVAADVLLYLRELTDLFAAVADALAPSGLFAFSTELGLDAECGGVPPEGRGWVERSSERIAHSEEYLRHIVATTAGLEWRSLAVIHIRNEARKPLQGHLCVVSRTAA